MSVTVIVVGIDDSPGSGAAAAWAADLAGDLGARVVAVHAYEPLAHVEDLEPGRDFAGIRDEIAVRLDEVWCRPLHRAGIVVETVVAEGRPADVLVDVARDVEADLVIVGARRMGLVRTLTLGSTSARVIHESPCPVTVIHPPEP